MGKRVYVRIKIGTLGGEDWYDKNYWVSLSNDSAQDFSGPVARWVEDNFDEIMNDDSSDDDEGDEA